MHLQQLQRRLLSVQSEDTNPEEASATAAAVEEAPAAAEEGEPAEGEVTPPPTGSPEPLYLIQVDGLPFTMATEELEQWFEEAGCPPAKVAVPLWPERSMRAGQNKGKAYLNFSSEEDTQKALSLSGRSIGERWINISRLAMPLEEVSTTSRISAITGTALQLDARGAGAKKVARNADMFSACCAPCYSQLALHTYNRRFETGVAHSVPVLIPPPVRSSCPALS